MKVQFVVAAVISFIFLGSASAADKALKQYVSILDSYFEDARLDIGAPGLVYGIVAGGELKRVKAFGVRSINTGEPVTRETAFRIASMTKMMTALLIYDLYDQGKVSLDAPAEDYVPALKNLVYPTSDSRRVTVRDLVNHTAGFVTDDPWADRQMARSNTELDEFINKAKPFSTAPGERWEYSNLGYVLLGRIIENVSGQPFAQRMQERILDPLGMNGSGLEVREISDSKRAYGYQKINGAYVDEPVLESGSFDPLGGMWTTAEDYGQFIAWMLSAWPPRNTQEIEGAIPRRVIRMATDSTFLLNANRRAGLHGKDDCSMSVGYGMGLDQFRHCTIGLILGHGGGFPGYGTFVLMVPETGLGVFAFANVTYAETYGPVWDALAKLSKHGYGSSNSGWIADPALQTAYTGIIEAYEAGNITKGDLAFEDNFFLDRSIERWNAQISEINHEAGVCKNRQKLAPTGRLSGSFIWNCTKARVAGEIILSPVHPSPIQQLNLRIKKRDSTGRDMIVDFDFH